MGRRRAWFPEEPACWSWDLPMFPITNHAWHVRNWQDGRCAICGARASDGMLFEDHDHATGDIRGYLCTRCNTGEGHRDPHPVFLHYRRSYPTKMLGVFELKNRCGPHPMIAGVEQTWRTSLAHLAFLTDEKVRAEWAWNRQHEAAILARAGATPRDEKTPDWTPLIRAIHRVGLTREEWDLTLEKREEVKWADEIHLWSGSPPKQACEPKRDWRPPRRQGYMRRPCPDCWLIDPARLRLMIGDGYGHPLPGAETCGNCAGQPPIGFTCNSCGTVA